MEDNNQDEQKIQVKISDIMRKVKTKEDMTNIMREKGKINIYYFRIIFS